jgi:uncharacterized membrane protein
MSEENETGAEMHLTKGRLEGLSDGIFAFAMTLLVIGLNLPDKASIVQTPEFATGVILSLYSDFFHYVLAFLILGAFWLGHHIQYHSIHHIDRVFVWINLVTMMFVALLPFSTSFAGDFPDVPLGAIIFDLNLLAIGLGMFLQCYYATEGRRLVEPTTKPGYIRKMRYRSLILPLVSFVCILVALTGSTWSSSLYMSTPFVKIAFDRMSAAW